MKLTLPKANVKCHVIYHLLTFILRLNNLNLHDPILPKIEKEWKGQYLLSLRIYVRWCYYVYTSDGD